MGDHLAFFYSEVIRGGRKKLKFRWDRIAKHWLHKRGELEEWQLRERNEFAEKFPEKGLILDLGCGDGRDRRVFEAHRLKYVGLDFSKILTFAEDKSRLVCADAVYPPFIDESFDGVWSCSVLKYLSISDMQTCIKEVCRILKVGGCFWLGLDFGEGMIKMTNCNAVMEVMLYDQKALFSLIADSFKILDVKVFNRKERTYITCVSRKK